MPANAPQPWLPLQALSLRYADTPRTARAGDAVDVVVEAMADGANAAQMPELQLPAGDGAQVFAEPAQTDETFVDGRPRVKVTRKFSLVPARAGTLRIAGPRIEWWDVRAGRARTASLPAWTLQVAGAANGASAAPASPQAVPARGDEGERWLRVPGVQGEVRLWALATVIFALLWLATLMWALHRRVPAEAHRVDDAAAATHPAAPDVRGLRRALDIGDLGDVADALCALATPPARDLDEVRARLADPAQQAAVAAAAARALGRRRRAGSARRAARRIPVRTALACGREARGSAAGAAVSAARLIASSCRSAPWARCFFAP